MRNKISAFFDRVQQYILVQAMRRALISLIPILMIGSFAVLFSTFPVEAYIRFIKTWQDGFLYDMCITIQNVTVGVLSVYMSCMVGYHIGLLDSGVNQEKKYGTMIISLGSFWILSGAVVGETVAFGAKGMFLAIIAAGIGSKLYIMIAKRMRSKLILADGADVNLRSGIQTIFPALCAFLIIGLGNNLILRFVKEDSIYELLVRILSDTFSHIEGGFAGGLTYIILNSVMWFCGIHGSDVLESVADIVFLGPTEIFTRQYLNTYASIGGCGATICLFIALLLFSRRRGTRNLMKMSLIPMIFNINEIMLFGLPIIFNPTFLIPFILVPVSSFLIAYVAMWLEWVPLASNEVIWTTPILFNGYMTTGSVKGLLLQIFVIAVGVVIYTPFVKLYDKDKAVSAQKDYNTMVEKLKESENARTPIQLTDSSLSFGWMGKAIAADLQYAFEHGDLKLFYQPQFNDADECIGVEALLRWQHPTFGWVYPPLIIKLADESGIREKLEKWIVSKTMSDAKMLHEKYPKRDLKVSVNITGGSIQKKSFEEFLKGVAEDNDVRTLGICLEITEQDALMLDNTLRERFRRLKELGYMLAVDDFSMGSTSIGYLTGSHFELVKLDGSLVRGIIDNPRCREIIASIVKLSDSLEVQIVAEYVSDKEIREKLLEVGCRLYQGWYYSPAIPFEELKKFIDERIKNEQGATL